MRVFARRGHMCYRNDGIFFIILVMEKYPKNSLYADCPSCSAAVAGDLRGLACRQILRRRPLTSLEVLWRL